eukprot:CAMPEP_0181370600 /NCGR_PEP_ID=MMETSP1106-20121128/13524_1 /TAXON_ID=81844 /ORGANISM="Mantoniella antarctica, Strain SL-175" /LENGTH=201 /DNA_ID=CAMNT_0023487427 /DNA_START=242 /DNA_END=847 /DNA_ORIENTATION=-
MVEEVTKGGKSPKGKRAEAVEKAKQDAKVVDDTMRKYDTNRSGKLEQSQLALMLKDMNGGFDVTKEELAWVFYKADTCTGRRNYGVDHGEILYAIRIWKGYLENREYLDHMFEKYDTGRTGQLAFAELKVLLTDLTDPDEPPPSDKEVKQVMYEADRKDGEVDGSLKKVELMYAISLWYTMVKHRKSKSFMPLASKMCVVM